MNIERCTALTEEQEAEIRLLHAACCAPEALQSEVFLSNELNFDRTIPSFFLGRTDGILTSFLTLFLPTRTEGEVTAFTMPAFRRSGQFRRLCAEAADVLKAHGVPSLLFAVEGNAAAGQAALSRIGCTEYQHTEYRMTLDCLPTASTCTDVAVIPVHDEHADRYRALVSAVFERERDNCDTYADATLQNPLREGFMLEADGAGIGVCQMNYEDGVAFLYGLELLPAYRGKGYGEAFVRGVLQAVPRDRLPVILDVDSENQAALSLYRKLGFREVFRIDYHSMRI